MGRGEPAARPARVAPSWRVEIVPGTGHSPPVEAPGLIAERILAFPVRYGDAATRHETP
ncbi:hypothetical protein GCM10009733_012030 [Nonomuraea maheshkhaliensis]|uniref:Alpha/beta hydrolase n=1 Tax=Nonomuraea maheshkhaliensis TaxID=419590 RepID=A0ABN2ETJ2_9ACTN